MQPTSPAGPTRPEVEWVMPQRRTRKPIPVVEGSGHFLACAVAAGFLGVAAAVASWWLIGNQSVHTRPPEELDYDFRAPTVPHWVVAVFGPIALLVVVAILGAMIIAAARCVIDRRWLRVVALFMVAGFLFAGIGRIATAGVIGANIGGGILLFLLPAVAGLVVWAGFDASRIAESQRAHWDVATS